MNRFERKRNGRRFDTTVWTSWLTAAFFAFGFLTSAVGAASAETRTLRLYNLHTKEKAEITFKRNGSYVQSGLKEANRFLRDWRRNEPTKMDPRLLDLVWEAYKSAGSRDYIHVVCGYRAPATNSMLRSRSKGVAEKSQHMLGKAMDFYIPDVNLKTLRNIGLKAQVGGVGYYPRSGSPFVHMDVGNVRHWPKMSRKELVAVFPNGKTLHVPSDGKPLPGYETALAAYQSRKKSGGTALALASTRSGSRSGGLLASLFGGGADEEEDSAQEVVVAAKPAKPVKPAKAVEEPAEAKPSNKIEIVPPELADRAEPVEPAVEEETPQTILAALPARSIPLPAFAPRPQADVGPEEVPFGTADATLADAPVAAPTDEAVEEEIAANVPVPTWRPDYKPSQQAIEDDPVLLAMVGEDSDLGTTAGIPLPEGRPEYETVSDQEYAVAPLPEAAPAAADQIAAEIKENNARLAMLSASASPKGAIASSPKGSDPTLAIGGVKTTRKSARASSRDLKPEAKPLITSAQPEATRWALNSRSLYAPQPTDSVAPSAAFKIVRSAPSEVYATGFQQGDQLADAGRFSGKAVSFMPVARFETN